MSRTPEVLLTNFQSIVYRGKPPSTGEATQQPAFFVDLNLDQVIRAVTAGREEYRLACYYWTPLKEVEEVVYRQEIARDLENPNLSGRLGVFAEQMRAVRRRLPLSDRQYYKYQRERFFLEAAVRYCKAVVVLGKDLMRIDYHSEGLLRFREYLNGYVGSEAFGQLRREAEGLLDALDKVEYGVYSRGLTVQVRPRGAEIDYTREIERLFGRFRREGQAPGRALKMEEALARDEMNHVEGQILDGVAMLFPDLFRQLDEFCERQVNFLDERIVGFDRDIQFYLAYLEYIGKLRATGLSFCYPEVSTTDKETLSLEGFDLALAHKLTGEGRTVVCNDLSLSGSERFIIVSGPNQGGKTTFSRTVGQMHYLVALGLPVPGRQAKLFLPDRLFTHFERAEHAGDLRSKLEDDLIRLQEILTKATSGSLIILNEILSSATLEDALFLSRKLMARIDKLDALCVWVTFLDEIIGDSKKTVSMVSEMEPGDRTVRTYKIVRKPADGLAYAVAIAEKYGVTYDALKKRLNR